jgi:hypothetical protein
MEAGDIALGLTRAVLSILPGGGAAGELIGLVVIPGLQRRNRRWLRRMGESIDDMKANGPDVRTLADNDALITVILNASQAAARTHEEEKWTRCATRSRILSWVAVWSALPKAPEF